MTNITPVILCGGSGTRLWPLSRTGFPKQFLCLTGEESLFQQAARRLIDLGQVSPPLIVTNEEHRFLASEQLREAGIAMGAALLEPVGRNTAPALTLAALAAMENGGDPVLVVTPADQTVSDTAAFTAAMQVAVREAERGTIVILGVTPDAPETGYGYIQVASSSRCKRGLVGRRNRSAVRAASLQTNHCSAMLRSALWIATSPAAPRNDGIHKRHRERSEAIHNLT